MFSANLFVEYQPKLVNSIAGYANKPCQLNRVGVTELYLDCYQSVTYSLQLFA